MQETIQSLTEHILVVNPDSSEALAGHIKVRAVVWHPSHRQTRHMQHVSLVKRKSCVLQQNLHANQCRSCRGCVQADAGCLTEADRPELYRRVGCS